MKKNNYSEQIKKWGENNRALPRQNEALKQKVMNAVGPSYEPSPRIKFAFFRWALLATAAAAAFFLVVGGPNLYKKMTTPKYNIALDDMGGFRNGTEELGLSYGTDTGLNVSSVALGEKESRSFTAKIADVLAEPQSAPLDTRQYMDVYYNIEIKTRKVEKNAAHAETIIRGHGGRINTINSAKKNAYISFDVPKSEFESMKDALKELAGERFIEESVRANNLLPQKQEIENTVTAAQEDITTMENNKAERIETNIIRTAEWQKEINYLEQTIESLRHDYNATTDTSRRSDLSATISYYNNRLAKTKKDFASEQEQFESAIRSYDDSIAAANRRLDNATNQNQNLINNVETVSGVIRLEWISVISIINLYVSIRYLAVALFLIIIFYAVFGRAKKPLMLP